ncbi:MAG TPA: bifunctional DNA-formamidopyrimidine glycosylase/DNA-(apurinic or apyrimidinic site) lyase [Pseudonocardiaceae bacterium]|nr:bifunctional DNA-formamidopyrimidine glycosylase/DNA-(apurinic or apyrimidinic site) lyase [Pseudonocardiaceae bacterium]
MPELPEVEVVRRGLAEHVVGRTITKVDVLHPRAVRRHLLGGDDFAAQLAGRTIARARRRGKYLWLELTEPGVLLPVQARSTKAARATRTTRTTKAAKTIKVARTVEANAGSPAEALVQDAVLAHLGMSGQLRVQPVGAADEAHLRIRVRFADDGPELRFVDQRTFGGLAMSELVDVGGQLVPGPIAHIARDPMETDFDSDAVVAALRKRRTEVKRALLDQTLISGVGNIYADEALWRAKLHWSRPTEKLTRAQAGAVLAAAGEVMGEALLAGGTSFDALYVNVNGQSGYFSRSLAVYGQAGQPCPRCGTEVRREAFMNRSSYFCPRCQPPPRA